MQDGDPFQIPDMLKTSWQPGQCGSSVSSMMDLVAQRLQHDGLCSKVPLQSLPLEDETNKWLRATSFRSLFLPPNVGKSLDSYGALNQDQSSLEIVNCASVCNQERAKG